MYNKTILSAKNKQERKCEMQVISRSWKVLKGIDFNFSENSTRYLNILNVMNKSLVSWQL